MLALQQTEAPGGCFTLLTCYHSREIRVGAIVQYHAELTRIPPSNKIDPLQTVFSHFHDILPYFPKESAIQNLVLSRCSKFLLLHRQLHASFSAKKIRK
jgi:hypothetical protein